MKRVLVIGNGGTGKSTLSTILGRKLGLPVVHLDRFFWKPGWIETERSEWRRTVERLTAGEQWVMDGSYAATFDVRFPAADAILFLDFSRWLCMWRIFKRRMQYHGQTRPDLVDGCPEQFNWEFFRWVWGYQKYDRPKIWEAARTFGCEGKLKVFATPSDVSRFLQSLTS